MWALPQGWTVLSSAVSAAVATNLRLLSMKCKTENWTWIFTAETVTPVKFYKKVPVISFGPMEAVNPTDTTEDSILNSGDTKRTKLAVMIFYDWQGREFYLVGKSLNGIFADEKGDKR